ncbi:MAG: ribosome silencing factor [Lachnospiraceae bacterium]|nr:ribosome silencing factor [Lachnospiraceae bacterium]
MAVSAEAEKIIETGIKALSDKKAEDIKVIDISDISVIADSLVIASGNNARQIQAMSDELDDKLEHQGFRHYCIEGYENANWVLIGCGDVIFHLFDKETREFYDLERLYRDGRIMEVVS